MATTVAWVVISEAALSKFPGLKSSRIATEKGAFTLGVTTFNAIL